MFAFGKNKELLTKLEEYFKVVGETIDLFKEAMLHMLKNGTDEHFRTLTEKTHHGESNADDVRRNIELDMYQKSLLPESRGDLLGILETIDRIPNRAERILFMFITQQTTLLPEIKPEMEELLHLSVETIGYTIDATRDCFGQRNKIHDLNRQVDNNESVGDNLERKMITTIFASDELDTGEKILQKEMVVQLGAMCDLCENTLDRIMVASVKRQI